MAANPYQSPQAASLPARPKPARRFSFLEIFVVGHIVSFFLLLLAPSFAASSAWGEVSFGRELLSGVMALFARMPWLVVVLSLWGGAATTGGFFMVWRVKRLLVRFFPK